MELKDKLPTMSDSAKLSLLTQEVKLIRRPILVGDGLVLVGFNEDDWSRALSNREKGTSYRPCLF